MAGVVYQEGLDADFAYPLGKDAVFSDDNETYRICQRVDLLIDNRKYYNLKAVDPNNSVQQFQLDVADESKLTVIDCTKTIQNVWHRVTYNGNFLDTVNYINNSIFARCDVQNRLVNMSVDGTTFKLDFDGTIYTVEKS